MQLIVRGKGELKSQESTSQGDPIAMDLHALDITPLMTAIKSSHQRSPGACNFIKKEILAQVFSCEFCEISKNTVFTEHLWTTASEQLYPL